MLDFIDGFDFKLRNPIQPTDDSLPLNNAAIDRLNELAEGDHVYITLHFLDKYEVVKFTKEKELKYGDAVSVFRDVETKGRKNFPCGSCVTIRWNKITMDEYIAQSTKGDK